MSLTANARPTSVSVDHGTATLTIDPISPTRATIGYTAPVDPTRTSVQLSIGLENNATETIQIPFVNNLDPITPETIQSEGTLLAALPWGDTDGHVGRGPDTDAERVEPTSLAIDPETGNTLIVDAANHRIVALDPTGQHVDTIELDIDGLATDIVIDNELRTAVVSEFSIADGELSISAHVVSLADGRVTKLGPEVLPDGAPTNLELAANLQTHLVYGQVDGLLYPFVDIEELTLIVDREPLEGAYARAIDGGVGYQFGDAAILTDFPNTAASGDDLAVDAQGVARYLVSTVELDNFTADGTTYLLLRTDPTAQATIAIVIQPIKLFGATRTVAFNGDTATTMNATDSGIELRTHYFSDPP